MGKAKMISSPCRVLPGMFSTECQVIVTLPTGQEIDALVDRQSVKVEEEPEVGKPVNGFVQVSLVEHDKKANQVLVDLPQGSFTKGPRIRVPSQMVQAA